MDIKKSRKYSYIAVLLFLLGVFFIALPIIRAESINPNPQTQGVDDTSCLACHQTPDLIKELPSGEVLYLTIDQDTYYSSVHGKLGYACVQCHTDIPGYPHPKFPFSSRRDLTLKLYSACLRCHPDKYGATMDSTHQIALAAGNKNAAVCTDCHGAHNIGHPDTPRSNIPQTCEKCHSEIYQRYLESVHGAALIGEGNPDVPSCIDCHGVHNIQGPTTGPFRLFSPLICAKCHTNPEIMDKYGIKTDVYDTYLSDFHGETVELFQVMAPGQQTNKPVCVDCHGVHDIKKTNDPESTVIKQNLLSTCQKCHPTASINFPAAWLHHYFPSKEHYPLVYAVKLFYRIFIPVTIFGLSLFVVSDLVGRIFRSRKDKRS